MLTQKSMPIKLLIVIGVLLFGFLGQQQLYADRNNDPYIDKIEPSFGAPNTKATITGINLGVPEKPLIGDGLNYPGVVEFGRRLERRQAKVIDWNDERITVLVPDSLASRSMGEVDVRVVMLPARAVKSNSVKFTYLEPSINVNSENVLYYDISPSSGYEGTQVTIRGENFGDERGRSSVRFGASTAKILKWSDTEIVVSAPKEFKIVDDAKFIKTLLLLGKDGLLGEDEILAVAKAIAPELVPELITLKFSEDDHILKSIVKILSVLIFPGVKIEPGELERDGYYLVAVTVKTSEGETSGLFKYGFPEIITPPNSTVAIVMDTSGSMGRENRLASAKAAANSYIDSSNENDWLALVSYASTAKPVVILSSIAEGKESFKRGVSSLSARGNTNIGAGLEEGLDQLFSISQSPDNPIIILLSDGIHNTGELWPSVEKCQRMGVKVYTVPFGKDADHATLQKIAQMTDGRISEADTRNISYVYHRINSQIENRSTLFASNDFLKPNQQVAYMANIDPGVSELTFYTSWQGSRVIMELIDPSGNKIIPSNSIGRHIEEPTYNIFEIDSQPGQWQMIIEGRDFPFQGEQVNISISGKSSLYTNFLSFQPEYSPGSNVPIAVEVARVQGLDKIPLTGVKVTAQIRKPPVTVAEKTRKGIKIDLADLVKSITIKRDVTLALYDNSLNISHMSRPTSGFGCAATPPSQNVYKQQIPPGTKTEGIFTNNFSDTNIKGPYLVTVNIEAELENGQQINRQIIETFQVGPIDENELTSSEILKEFLGGILLRN